MSIIGTQDDKSDEQLSSAVHKEMEQWFGSSQVADWQLLKVYRVSFAQPNQASPADSPSVCVVFSCITFLALICFLHVPCWCWLLARNLLLKVEIDRLSLRDVTATVLQLRKHCTAAIVSRMSQRFA